MTVTQVASNILTLEYRQQTGDEFYGSCLWARFYFNLDRYELFIMSDCGNYGYKWYETPDSESFLELMARINKDYLLEKLYGSADIFDFDETKERIYDCYGEEAEDKKKLDEIFNAFYYGEPETAEAFIMRFEEENNGYFCDVWEMPRYVYPAAVLRVCQVFDENIKPKIKEILSEKENRRIYSKYYCRNVKKRFP